MVALCSARVAGHLPVVVLQLLRTLVDTAHHGRRDFVSSVVVADLLWWLARWSRPYLLLKEGNYTGETTQLSMALLTAFGEGADSVAATVDALLDLVRNPQPCPSMLDVSPHV